MTEKFVKDFQTKIYPILCELETLRKKELNKLISAEFICAVLIVCDFLFKDELANLLGKDSFLLTFIALMFPFLIGIFIFLPVHFNCGFKSLIKKNCMPKIIQSFSNLEWQRGTCIFKEQELSKSRLFSSFNTISIDDSFKGRYKNTDFKMAEATLSEVTKGRRSQSINIIFNGIVISFPSNKTIKAQTIITSRNDFYINNYPTWLISGAGFYILYLILCFIGGRAKDAIYLLIALSIFLLILFFCTKKNSPKYEEVKLEDSVFAKRFKVYSPDQVEARYLVTTAFMERLANLNTVFGTDKTKCSFYDDRIMFAIHTKRDLFELGSLFTSFKTPKQIETFLKEIEAVTNMIDYFKLDEKTKL